MPDKVDLAKTLDAYRARRGEFRVVDVPVTQYLAIDGAGDPNTSEQYRETLETLYPVAYVAKFASKAAGRDYVVPPLEGLWWADDMAAFTTGRDKSRWRWTMLLMLPAWIDDEAPVLARMHDEVIPELGLRMTGRHHEIYLSDPRRTAPERLRTILRQPVVPR